MSEGTIAEAGKTFTMMLGRFTDQKTYIEFCKVFTNFFPFIRLSRHETGWVSAAADESDELDAEKWETERTNMHWFMLGSKNTLQYLTDTLMESLTDPDNPTVTVPAKTDEKPKQKPEAEPQPIDLVALTARVIDRILHSTPDEIADLAGILE